MKASQKIARWGALGLLLAAPAIAGNGHFLHGIGAINSSMGGAGVSVATDPLSSVHGNPALIAHMRGTQSIISTEFFKPSLSMSTRGTVPTPDGGTFFVDQTTESEDDEGDCELQPQSLVFLFPYLHF